MIDKDKFQELKKIIQDANPGIMELKMGCRVIWAAGKLSEGIPGTILGMNYAGNWLISIRFLGGGSAFLAKTIKRKEIKEVLGRDIRLADVLMALGSSKFNPVKKWNFFEENNLDRQHPCLIQDLIEELATKEESCKKSN